MIFILNTKEMKKTEIFLFLFCLFLFLCDFINISSINVVIFSRLCSIKSVKHFLSTLCFPTFKSITFFKVRKRNKNKKKEQIKNFLPNNPVWMIFMPTSSANLIPKWSDISQIEVNETTTSF